METSLKPTLSNAQLRALNPKKSCWVEASAGSGKTKVLTDRIARLLVEGVPFDHILCLTFTNAGAIEMASRLQQRLHQWTQMDDTNVRDDLKTLGFSQVTEDDIVRARSLFDALLDKPFGVRIQTLHAFCQFLLRTFPLEVGLVPHFEILDDLQRLHLQKKAFSHAISSCSPDTIHQMATHGSLVGIEKNCQELLSQKKEFLSDPHLPSFIATKKRDLSRFLKVQEGSTPDTLAQDFIGEIPDFQDFESVFDRGTDRDKELYRKLKDFKSLPKKIQTLHLSSYSRLFLTLKGEPRKKILSTQLSLANDLNQIMAHEAQRLINYNTAQSHHVVFHASLALMEVGHHYITEYDRLKKEKGTLDYDDLITLALKLLENAQNKPWILFKLEYEIHHILIDEAQDTSQEQWGLIAALVSEFFPNEGSTPTGKTLFVVGDIKQSIYSFQGADPKSFHAVKKLFSTLPNWDFIDLTTSYRSTPPVLAFVDQVFQTVSELSPSMSATYQNHESFRETTPGCVEIWPLIENDSDEETGSSLGWQLPTTQKRPEISRLKLALELAKTIEEWIGNHALIGRGRAVEPRDIMILVRRREAFVDELVRILTEKNIPTTGLNRLNLQAQIAVQDLLVLADVLLFPQNNLALATLLKSPLFGISESDLFNLAHNRGEQSLWDLLNSTPQTALYRQHIESYMALAASYPSPYDFFARALAQNNGWQRFMTRLGNDVNDTLEEFLTLCRVYQKNHAPHLQNFVSWVRQQPVEIKRIFDPAKENKIQILTVHGAKGLQSPIVIVPDTTQVPRERSSLHWIPSPSDTSETMVWIPDQSYQTPLIRELKQSIDTQEEYYRLLYVALTRAEDQLYICGWEPSSKRAYPSWYDVCRQSMGKNDAHREENGILSMGQRMTKKRKMDLRVPHAVPFLKSDGVPTSFPLPHHIKEAQPNSHQNSQQHKGIRLHKILEYIVHCTDISQMDKTIDFYLSSNPDPHIKTMVLNVLKNPKFQTYFNANTLTEVPVSGTIDGKMHQCVIDVLAIHPSQKIIYILDYKTGRRTSLYAHQLERYKALVQQIYPDYRIETALLWTESGDIEPV